MLDIIAEPTTTTPEKAVEKPPPPVPVARRPRISYRRFVLPAAEVAAALGAAGVLTLWSRSIDVDPLRRLGQVSGLAALQLRFAILGILTVAGILVAVRIWGRAAVPVVSRLGCAVVAGLTSGFLAGGSTVALRGTRFGFYSIHGDAGTLVDWAKSMQQGHSHMPAFYPPLPVHVLVWWSDLLGVSPAFAFKQLELVGAALFGPVAYLSWRLLLRPLPALAVGLVGMLPLVELYKPYENLVLIALVPLLAKFLFVVRSAPRRDYRRLVLVGVAFGVALAFLFLSYSGWYVWSAPGFVAALAIVMPWRRGLVRAVTFVGVAGVTMLALCGYKVLDLLQASGSVKDNYIYFDVTMDPAYFAMWRGGLPGNVAAFPPSGELGGVGLYTIVLCAGLAGALLLARRNPIVLTAACCFGGAWLMRFYYASEMFKTRNVQLYPRTSMEIDYLLLVLTVLAVVLAWRRLRPRSEVARRARAVLPGNALVSGLVGGLCALMLLLGSAASATVNNYLPHNDDSMGQLAWTAQTTRMPNGHCSGYVQADCKTMK